LIAYSDGSKFYDAALPDPHEPEMPNPDHRKAVEDAGLFDSGFYAYHNNDIGEHDPLDHYLTQGWRAGRAPSFEFDGARYLDDHPDVRAAGLNPLIHYVLHGKNEGRRIFSPRKAIEETGLFDVEFYLAQKPNLAGSDPLWHYAEKGWRDGLSPSDEFDGPWYLNEHSDVRDAGINPLIHYVSTGAAEGRIVSQRIHKLAKQFISNASHFEPQIETDTELRRVERLPLAKGIAASGLLFAWDKLLSSVKKSYDFIIFTPWLVRGGADLVVSNAARSVIERYGARSVLVVVADYDRLDSIDWLPAYADVLVLSDFGPELGKEERTEVVKMLIFSLAPGNVLNVNSFACWEVFRKWGKALGQTCDLYAALFCSDFSEDGIPGGYADTHFRACLPVLTKVYIDNETFLEQLAKKHDLPQSQREKLTFLPQPISPAIRRSTFVNEFSSQRMPVMWAGRFCRQKNINLLLEIIRNMPDVQFDIYGDGEEVWKLKLEDAERLSSNISLKGSFTGIDALPTNQYTAFLYTSLWDGMPTTLINLATLRIPIVASAVGGVRELVNDETGWPIDDYDNPEPYERAISEIASNPQATSSRVNSMYKHVQARHSWESYTKALLKHPSFISKI
jgi:glycosyltransferase involved in cell wall biosynthesis